MRNLLAIIKQAALDAVAASKPTEVVFGKVEQLVPLSVCLSGQLVLDEDFFVCLPAVHRLQVGDTVALLRMQQGQRYLILDKVVNPNVT